MSGSLRHERTFFQLLSTLERESRRRIELQINRNRVSYVTFQDLPTGGRVRVRLQRAFLSAPERVISALADWIRAGRGRAPHAVRRFIESHAASSPAPPPRPMRISTRGDFHDLAEIAAEVNRECFRGQLRAAITWGRAVNPRRKVHQRQLGTFDRERNLVTISRVLDNAEVPRFFVAFVVFHEMLHAVQGDDEEGDHGPEFRRVERMHPDYRRAEAWQRRNMGLLMNPASRSGRKSRRRAAKTVRDRRGEQGLLF
jgi:hypothetical protein